MARWPPGAVSDRKTGQRKAAVREGQAGVPLAQGGLFQEMVFWECF